VGEIAPSVLNNWWRPTASYAWQPAHGCYNAKASALDPYDAINATFDGIFIAFF
jgi:hypothetical protein